MDARGQVYFGSEENIPDADKRRLAEAEKALVDERLDAKLREREAFNECLRAELAALPQDGEG